MTGIIATYGLEGVVVITIVVIAALVGIANWLYSFYTKSKEIKEQVKLKVLEEEKLYERIDQVEKANAKQDAILSEQSQKLDILVRSDKSRIKGEILKQYQYFEDKGYIDSQTLEYLNQQYDIYREEGGNSWVHSIMERIYELPLKEAGKK